VGQKIRTMKKIKEIKINEINIRIGYDRLFPIFGIRYRELYGKQKAAIEIFIFHAGIGVLFSKKVKRNSKHVIDI
jgi:hypothetical protein